VTLDPDVVHTHDANGAGGRAGRRDVWTTPERLLARCRLPAAVDAGRATTACTGPRRRH
jgi:hypothetical protein